MKDRLLNSLWIILIVLLVLWLFQTWGAFLLSLVFSVFVFMECCQLLEKMGGAPLKKTGLACCLLLLSASFLYGLSGLVYGLVFSLGVLLFTLFLRADLLKHIAPTLLALLYVPFLLSFYLLCFREFGVGASLWAIALVKASDSGAFWVGTHLGRRPLCVRISPKKTVEGALGGLATSVLVGLVLFFLLPKGSSIIQAALAALFIGFFAIFSDLLESQMKRQGRVKDSGSLKGLGGALDIADSLLLTAPVSYFILLYWMG